MPRRSHLRRLLVPLFCIGLAVVPLGGSVVPAAQAHSGDQITATVASATPAFGNECIFDNAAAVAVDSDAVETVEAIIERTDSDLYICVTGIEPRGVGTDGNLPAPNGNDEVQINLDIDHAGHTDGPHEHDYQFDIVPNGATAVSATANSGGLVCLPTCFLAYVGPDPGGWQAAGADTGNGNEFHAVWTAWLKVSKATLGNDWGKTVGLMISYTDGANGRTGNWPAAANSQNPSTWADLILNIGDKPVINMLSPIVGMTPQALQPGTTVYLTGYNLCANNPVVQFNTTVATDTACNAADGTQVIATVPRLATSGNVVLRQDNGNSATAPEPFTVLSYPNQNGFSFGNFTGLAHTLSVGDFVDLYGADQMFIQFDICAALTFGLAHCPAPTGIPRPDAWIFYLAVRDAGQGGLCFGFTLSSQRFLHSEEPFNDYTPPDATTVHQLEGPGGPSSALDHYLNVQHISQYSREFLQSWAEEVSANFADGAQRVHSELVGAFAQNPPDYPLVSLRNGTDGHVVIAYDLEDGNAGNGGDGNGDYFIDVYDPNQPDNGTPPNSRIHVRPDNTWSFHGNFDGDSDWGGDMNALAVVSSRVIPLHPTLPTLESLIEVHFDSGAAQTAQVSDAAGRTLFAADGSVNGDPTTRLSNAALFIDLTGAAQPVNAVVISSTNAFTYTLAGTGSGVYSSTLFSNGFIASLQNVSATSAISDQVMIDPSTSSLNFHTGGQKALMAKLIGQAADHSLRTVTLNTTSFHEGSDGLSFDTARKTLTYRHAGAATTANIALDWLGEVGTPASFTSPPMTVRSGDRVSITPSDWSDLLTSSFTVTTTHSDGSQAINLWTQPPLVRLLGASLIHPPGLVHFEATAKATSTASGITPLASLQASSTLSGTWQTLSTLSGTGPVTVTTAFNVTDPAFGGSATPGPKTFYVRALDAAGNSVFIAPVPVTYDIKFNLFLPLVRS